MQIAQIMTLRVNVAHIACVWLQLDAD